MIEDITMEKLEKRMYYFVIYQLMGIQKGIQCDHAGKRYARKYGNDLEYIDYVDNWETIITLDGGTTNDDEDGKWYGSLNQIVDDLEIREIKHSAFREPDLNNAITAVCFLADERVWNFEKYPDFTPKTNQVNCFSYGSGSYNTVWYCGSINSENSDGQSYEAWVEYMGGEGNLFLRELIKDKKLAKN